MTTQPVTSGEHAVETRTRQLVYDMSGRRDLLTELAAWAQDIRTRPWEGTKPWPTSSP